jgi:hypothetical protein
VEDIIALTISLSYADEGFPEAGADAMVVLCELSTTTLFPPPDVWRPSATEVEAEDTVEPVDGGEPLTKEVDPPLEEEGLPILELAGADAN